MAKHTMLVAGAGGVVGAAAVEHFCALPDWEVPNMITKYATIMQAYRMSRPAAVTAPAAAP